MSVFGVDLACLNSVVAITRNGGVDIILNEVSKRETATFIGLTDQERAIGESGLDRYVRNLTNTVSCIKHWIGAREGDEGIAAEKRFLFCNTVADDEGRIKFALNYQGEPVELYPEQVLAMFLQQLRKYVNRECTVDKNHPADVRDCVLTVPSFYSAEQKRLVQQAAEIAGINCMSLIHETTSASIDYGIFRGSSLPDTEETAAIVGILDIGYGHTSCTINKFWKGNMRVLSRGNDLKVGCREIDYALAQHFATEIQKKYKIDVLENKRARLRVLQGVEKVKNQLSANITSALNIENLMDVDVNIQNFTRDEFEALIAPIMQNLRNLITTAIAEAGITAEQLVSLEVIGGGSRIPLFKQVIAEVIGKQGSYTLNATECVAKGAAITAAVYSPKFQVREFVVNELSILPILGGHTNPANEAAPAHEKILPGVNDIVTLVGPKDTYPKVLDVTIKRSDEFSFHVFYDSNAPQASAINQLRIGEWKIGSTNKPTDGVVKIRVRVLPTGLTQIDAAWTHQTVEVDVEEEQADPADAEKKIKVTVKKSKKERVELTCTPVHVLGHSSEVILAARKQEEAMNSTDLKIIRTKEIKNLLESYILDNRSRVDKGGYLSDYVTEADRATFLTKANEDENWLYDDGSDATYEEYEKRLNALKTIGEPATARHRLVDDAPYALKKFIERIRAVQTTVATKQAAKPEHISQEELNSAADKCDEAIKYGEGLVEELLKGPKSQDATWKLTFFDSKVAEVSQAVNAVVNKPKPKPKPVEKPAEAAPSPTEETDNAAQEGEVPPPPTAESEGPKAQTDLD
eukprot:GILI01001851.1.p1 GENE.GILI01001851.1~~GILI01001851.1.p1  ORF type:complete len:805 (-),score=310.11 GILI01001851.1:409-2823(-)